MLDRRAPGTHADYEAMCRLRLVPALGGKALDEISPDDVAVLRRKLSAEGLSPARVNRHLAVLRAALGLAIEWGLRPGPNPAGNPGMTREEPRQRFLTETEARALMRALDAEPDRDGAAAVALLLLTGARRSEVLDARWQHVDIERRLLAVPRSKSGRARYLSLSDAALAVLASLPRPPGSPFLFPSPRRQDRPREGLRSVWARAKRAAGLDGDIRLHDLRHTFASLLANRGHSLYEIGQLLGHTQLATTQRYAHLTQRTLIDAANEVGRVATGDIGR